MKSQQIQKCLAAVVVGLVLGSAQNVRAAEEVDYQPFSLTAEAGTLGLGGSLSWRFSDHLGVRGGFNYFEFDYTGEQEGNEYNLNLHLESIPLGVDFYFSKASTLRITAGVLLNKNKFGGSVTGPSVDLDGTTYTDPDLKLNLELKPEDVSPFITIGGTLYFGKNKHVGLSLEGGVAYLPGGYDVTLTRNATLLNPANTAIDTDLENERLQLQSSAKDFKLYPIFKIGVTVSF